MTGRWSAAQRDRALALIAGAVAAAFIAAARGIEDSLLSDSVGAGGVPQGVGITMAVAALALFVKSLLESRNAPTPQPVAPPVPRTAADDEIAELPRKAFVLRTVGLVLILCAYAVLLPLAGYPLSIGLLVLSAGWLAGARLRLPLLLTALLAGPLLWGLFGFLLQVRMPAGSWWG